MKPRSRILLALLLIAIFGASACLLLRPRKSDPLYKGKPLSYWLHGYTPDYAPGIPITSISPTYAEADDAVRHLGTNALPLLLRLLQTPDASLKSRLIELAHLQPFIRVPYTPATDIVQRSIDGFQSLGRNALPAVPQLINFYEKPPNSFTTGSIPLILSYIGPSATDAVPMLVQGTTDTNAFIRQTCAFTLGAIHGQPVLSVPALVKCLEDTYAVDRATAAHSLAAFGQDARAAVPALLKLLTFERTKPRIPSKRPRLDADVTGEAIYALRTIDPQAAAQAGIK